MRDHEGRDPVLSKPRQDGLALLQTLAPGLMSLQHVPFTPPAHKPTACTIRSPCLAVGQWTY